MFSIAFFQDESAASLTRAHVYAVPNGLRVYKDLFCLGQVYV